MVAGNSLKLILESLLFVAEKPLNAREINGWLPDCNVGEIAQALKELQQEYETMDRSFVLNEVAGGYQFRTRSRFAPYILEMLKASPTRLSRAALETLAIIAYKQPILRHEIERLRGVDVGGILRTLLEKDLIRILGRRNLPGRPLIYGTTNKFLEIFDLKDLESLPKLKEIKELDSDAEQQEFPDREAAISEGTHEESPTRGEEQAGQTAET
jgi:segregation and condensation protein B